VVRAITLTTCSKNIAYPFICF